MGKNNQITLKHTHLPWFAKLAKFILASITLSCFVSVQKIFAVTPAVNFILVNEAWP